MLDSAAFNKDPRSLLTTDGRIQRLVALLLAELPEDGSNIGNGTLFDKLTAQAAAAALTFSEDDFHDWNPRQTAVAAIGWTPIPRPAGTILATANA